MPLSARRSAVCCTALLLVLFLPALTSVPVFAETGTGRQSLTDLTLAKSLEIATENSPDMQRIPFEVEAAELNSENAELEKWPALHVSVEYEIGDKIVEEDAYGKIKPYLTLTKDIIGQVDVRYEKEWSAMTRKMSADLLVFQSKRNLYLEVADKYYTLLLAKLKKEQEYQSFNTSKLDLDEAKSKYADGIIPQLEVIRAETNLSYSSLKQLTANNALEYAEAEFRTILNLPRETELKTGQLEKIHIFNFNFDQLKRFAEQNNAELAIYEAVIDKLPEFERLAGRISWPTVSASAFIGEGGQWGGSEDEDTYGMRVTVTQPLYDYGIKKRKRKILEQEIHSLKTKLQAFRTKYYYQLDLLHKKFIHAGLELQQLQTQVDHARILAEKANRSYELGLTSYTDMLQHRNTARESEYNFAASKTKYVLAEISMKLAAGEIAIEKLTDQTLLWPSIDE